MIRGLLVLLMTLFAAAPAVAQGAAGPPLASDARIAGDRTRTRFIADLSRSVDIAVFALADPYRVIVDLPELDFRLAPESGREGRGLVSAYRFGLFGPGKSRFVLDVTGPVEIDKAFVLAPIDNQPARLVVDLVETTREAFLASDAFEAGRHGRGERAATPPRPSRARRWW